MHYHLCRHISVGSISVTCKTFARKPDADRIIADISAKCGGVGELMNVFRSAFFLH